MGFSKKVCHRDGEVDVIIPEFVEEKEIVKRIQCLHCSDKFVKKISASDCSKIVLIFRAISASMFLLSLFLFKKKSVYTRPRLVNSQLVHFNNFLFPFTVSFSRFKVSPITTAVINT